MLEFLKRILDPRPRHVQARKPRPTFKPRLEALEERWCPATATWNGTVSTDWTNPNNWTWTNTGGVNLNNNYPGDTATRTTDDVVIGNTRQQCKLGVNLAASLDGLTIQRGAQQVVLGGNVTVTGQTGFDMAGPQLLNNATLTIGPNASFSDWIGGSISGTGTVNVAGGTLYIELQASSLSNQLNVTKSSGGTAGIVKLFNMGTNLALNGLNNGIDIQNGGEVNLDQSNGTTQADTFGGITGSANNLLKIEPGGLLERGSGDANDNPYGSVLVSNPVINAGGLFWLKPTTVGTNPSSVVHLTGKDTNGYSYEDLGSNGGAALEIDQTETLKADNGVKIGANTSDTLQFDEGTVSSPQILGNVTLDKGQLSFKGPGSAQNQYAYIGGNLTLTSNSTVNMNWGTNYADWLEVNGTVNLGNAALVMFGDTAPAKNTLIGIIEVLNGNAINGSFGSFSWFDHPGTNFIHDIQVDDDNTSYYQVGQTSQ